MFPPFYTKMTKPTLPLAWINAIRSGCRSGRAVKRVKSSDNDACQPPAPTSGRSELDTRADTCCAGFNCRLIHYTGQECDVKGFHGDLDTIPKVPIATVATMWCDPTSGEGYILILNEVLFFGNKLDHSLINPNQIRHNGIPVFDNPYEQDPNREMGIAVSDACHIPFESEGSTIFFCSSYPTDDEMDSYPHVVLTCDTPWDPQGVVMPGGATRNDFQPDRLIAKVQSNELHGYNRHHHMYESDCVAHSTFGSTEQLFMERMIQSIVIDHGVNGPVIRTGATIAELHSTQRHSQFTPEHISKIWNVGIGIAKDILATTTQKGVRHAVLPMSRRYRVDHLNLHAHYLAGTWTMDHVESKYKSIRGHTGSFVFSNGNLSATYPTATKNDDDATESLRRFCDEIGVPANLKSDMAGTFTGRHTDFQKAIRKYGIKMTFSEPHRHNQLQQVDGTIRDLKRRWRTTMTSKNVPRRLWCFGLEHQARLMQFIPRGRNERTGYEMITGRTPDISEYCDFDFYDLVWYWRAPHPSMAEHDRELARWMGVAHRYGSDMCYWLMPVSGIPIVTTTVQHVTADDYRDPDLNTRINEFNDQLCHRLDDTNFVLPGNDVDYYPNDVYDIPLQRDTADGDLPTGDFDSANDEQQVFDNLIGATFLLDPLRAPNNVATQATVIRRKTDPLGIPLGKYHANPLLDTREYEVELEDGTYDSYFANTIAENLWSQCDAEGRQFSIIREIIGHRTDGHAIPLSEGTYMVNGQQRLKKTTAGWKINVEFSDGTSDWLHLRDVKDSNPIELAEYAIASQIDHQPAFR